MSLRSAAATCAVLVGLLGAPAGFGAASPPAGSGDAAAEAAADETVSLRVPLGAFADDLPTLVDPTARYTLYLPRAYGPERLWPVLLVFDPRGRARMAAELFRPAAERYGWILVSSNDTRSDESWDPNRKAVRALWPEIRRFAIDPERIYAAGFSGGAILAWIVGQSSGELAGVIGVGGRLPAGVPAEDPPFVHWGAAGSWDFNVGEMRRIDRLLAQQGVPRWLEVFPGPHRWFDAELATQAVGWMELQAMRRGLRPRDEALVDALWEEWLAEAGELEAAGDPLGALERAEQMAGSFEGLRSVEPARELAARLGEDREVSRQRRERRRWDARVERFDRRTLPVLMEAAGDDLRSGPGDGGAVFSDEAGAAPATAPLGRGDGRRLDRDELRRRLGLDRLFAQAAGDGYEAVAAKRMLHLVHTQASFYLPREWIARGDWRAARTVLELALEIDASSPRTWLDLGRCAAALGDDTRALEALGRAVENGWRDPQPLRENDELATLRAAGRLDDLLRALGTAAAPGSPEAPTATRESPGGDGAR